MSEPVPLLPMADLCAVCHAVVMDPTHSGQPMHPEDATILMTIRDETGRRAVIRTEIAKEVWLDLDPQKAGVVIVSELRAAHASLKRQAARDAAREAARQAQGQSQDV